MDVHTWLMEAVDQLKAAGITTARLDALVLLEDTLGQDRAHLLAHPELLVSDEQQAVLKKLLNRRAAHEPLSYLRGQTEFFGRKFTVSNAVLEPRPESETMIELLIALSKASYWPPTPRIADVGTGSGALGITVAHELPDSSIDLLDIDDAALAVAKVNVINHTTPCTVIKSDLLADSAQDYDVLLCNLPYVPDDFAINTAAGHEPEIAIFGGPDGLNIYRKLFAQIEHLQKRPLYILTEALPTTHDALAQIALSGGYQLVKTDDFIQLFIPAAAASAL